MGKRTQEWSHRAERKEKTMISTREMLEKVQDLKEQTLLCGLEKPQELDEFFNENWVQILDILDDALYEHLHR